MRAATALYRVPAVRVLLGALALWALCGGRAPAAAQTAGGGLTVAPASVAATVQQHETTTRTVTLTNAGDTDLAFCLSFDRPLQRVAGWFRLADEASGGAAPCGEYGEVLYYLGEDDVDGPFTPYGITMTPGGRLFTAELGAVARTFELTPELAYIGSFEHPRIAELEPFPATRGIGYDPEGASGEGSLWWMNFEESGGTNGRTLRVLLLEGSLNGEPTGRRIEIAPPDDSIDTFDPAGVAYDPATDLFYFSAILGNRGDPASWKLWTVDREGNVPEGYPLRPEPYPEGRFGIPDAHGGAAGGPEGVRVEYARSLPSGPGRDRVVVVDRSGEGQGEALETPVPPDLFEGNGAGIRGNPLRSRTDPNGVMYMTFVNFDDAGIVGVRPHPLPPSWLVVDSDAGPEAAWDGVLGPGESREVSLTLRAGGREVGSYTSALQAFDAATGEAVVVPLSLTVTQGTNAEDKPAAPEASSLTVYPNPTAGRATVTLALAKAAEVRAVVYDVLGRGVAVLHEGPLSLGAHRLALGGDLPAGVYLVRATGDGVRAAQRVTVVR